MNKVSGLISFILEKTHFLSYSIYPGDATMYHDLK